MNYFTKQFPIYLLLVWMIFSCKTYSESDIKKFDEEITSFIKNKEWNMQKLESGLYYEIIVPGDTSATIKLTDNVTFGYKGSFINGESFQTVRTSQPVTFQARTLIAGWQDALSLIGNKGKIRIILPPHLGYGAKETGVIPANSILVYELEVVDVE